MTTPSWMPPLPDVEQLIYQRCRTYVADNQRAAIEELMREYAEAYRKAWVESLKPVASLRSDGKDIRFMDSKYATGINLYLLDDKP